jgi:hypothetical protein
MFPYMIAELKKKLNCQALPKPGSVTSVQKAPLNTCTYHLTFEEG